MQLLAGAALDLAAAAQFAGVEAPVGRELAVRDGRLADLQAAIAAPEAYLVGGVAGRGLRAVGDAKETLTAAVQFA